MRSEERIKITIADLRNILNFCVEMGYINEHAMYKIIDLAIE